MAHKRLRERRARSLELGVPATGREQLPLPVVDGPGASGPLAAEDRGGQGVEGGHADAGPGQVPSGCHWPNTAVAMATPKTPPVFWNVEPTPLARLAAVAES